MKKNIITGVLLIILLINLSQALIIDSVSLSPSSISPGETSKISLSLKNNGEIDLEDVSISLDLTNIPLAPYNSGSDYSFNELNEGKIKEAEFEIIAQNNAKSGLYKIPVKIEYKEDDQIKTKNSLISVTINSEPIVDISLEEVLLLNNQKNDISLKIVNKGLGDVKFLEVEIQGNTNYYTITSPEKVYIGDVDSDDFQTAEFKMFIKEKTPSKLILPVTIRYKDINNKEFEQYIEIPLKVYTNTKAQELGLISKNYNSYLIILIIVAIVLFFIYRLLKRRKKEEY